MIRAITGIPASLAICLALTGLAMPSSAAQPAPPPPDHMMPMKAKAAAATQPPAPPAMPSPEEIETLKLFRAVIVTKYGNIEIAFFPDVAPVHVANFVKLSRAGFYDGTAFHRIVPDFMIQGGDPDSKDPSKPAAGMGGPGYRIKAELSDRPHLRGTLSMARFMDLDSAGSQFFICVGPAPWLDRQYSVFGEVVSGMDVVDAISRLPRDPRFKERPVERVEIKVKIIEPSSEARPGGSRGTAISGPDEGKAAVPEAAPSVLPKPWQPEVKPY